MTRLIGAAAAMALAATSPLAAQGNGKGNGNGNVGEGRGQAKELAGNPGADLKGRGKSAERASAKPPRANVREPDKQARRADQARDVRADREDGRRDDYADEWARRDGDDGLRFADRWDADRRYAAIGVCPPGLAKKNTGCLPPGQARQLRDEVFGFAYRPSVFGLPLRTGADYVYYDGYLIPSGGSRAAYVPLLGGALAVGQVWPARYPSYGLEDWQRGYYGFDDPGAYRYADNVVYRIDPETAAIQGIVALLTGADFTVGQPMPVGYDVYNVPAAYRDRYYDTDDALYRYADGRIYQIDPATMLISQAIEMVL